MPLNSNSMIKLIYTQWHNKRLNQPSTCIPGRSVPPSDNQCILHLGAKDKSKHVLLWLCWWCLGFHQVWFSWVFWLLDSSPCHKSRYWESPDKSCVRVQGERKYREKRELEGLWKCICWMCYQGKVQKGRRTEVLRGRSGGCVITKAGR